MNLNPSPRSYNFVKALEFTLPWEVGRDRGGKLRKDGGLHYHDGGQATKWGIHQAANPDIDVASLTLEQACEIYKERYWLCYLFKKPTYADLDAAEIGMAVALFDAGVNCGEGRAWGWFIKHHKEKDPVPGINQERGLHYAKLKASGKPQYVNNYNGWIRRLNDLKKYVDVLRRESVGFSR